MPFIDHPRLSFNGVFKNLGSDCVCDIWHFFCTDLQAAVKSKKATDTYKLYVEKYAAFKSDFEQKMTETAQVSAVLNELLLK